MHFITDEELLWIMNSMILSSISYMMFLSDSHSDGTHSLMQ